MKELYNKLKIPEKHKSTSITPEEALFIHEFLKAEQISKTLEIGFAYGCSSAYIISATKSKHFAIDPFQESYSNLGLTNMEKLGFKNFLEFIPDFSHNALPQLHKEGLKVDFSFIDGGHRFDEIFVDFYYVDLLLNVNGYVLFHDSWMQSTQNVVSWILKNKKNYTKINTPIKNLVLFQKNSVEDNRTWYHFKNFNTYKSFFKNKLFIIKGIIKNYK